MNLVRCAATLALVGFPSVSQAATYFGRALIIPGATSVTITGLNDYRMAVGTYVSPSQPYGAGYEGWIGQTQTLPIIISQQGAPQVGIFAPVGINNRGTIVGTSFFDGDAQNVLRSNGKYSGLGFSQGQPPTAAPFVGTADHVTFNDFVGDGISMGYVDTPSGSSSLTRLGNAVAISTNGHLQVAGEMIYSFAPESVVPVVFVGDGAVSDATLYAVIPPHSRAAFGGWINDAGQIAGSSVDKSGGLHGFVFYKHAYTSFDMPTKPTALTVQAIDSSGRVVGSYTDARSTHGFIYAGGTVTNLGTFPAADAVQVSISPLRGLIGLTDTKTTGSRAWIVYCETGTGC